MPLCGDWCNGVVVIGVMVIGVMVIGGLFTRRSQKRRRGDLWCLVLGVFGCIR